MVSTGFEFIFDHPRAQISKSCINWQIDTSSKQTTGVLDTTHLLSSIFNVKFPIVPNPKDGSSPFICEWLIQIESVKSESHRMLSRMELRPQSRWVAHHPFLLYIESTPKVAKNKKVGVWQGKKLIQASHSHWKKTWNVEIMCIST